MGIFRILEHKEFLDSFIDYYNDSMYDVKPYYNGGDTDYYFVSHPGDIPNWVIKESYRKRGKVYKCYDKELLSALIGELVRHDILPNNFALETDYVFVFVDMITQKCRYCFPKVKCTFRHKNKSEYKDVEVDAFVCFCFSEAKEAKANYNEKNEVILNIFETGAYFYTGNMANTRYCIESKYFYYYSKGLTNRVITFNQWLNKTTDGDCKPVMVVSYIDNEGYKYACSCL